MSSFYPVPSKEVFSSFIGQDIRNVPTPAAIIDLAAVKKNCAQMLTACDTLDLEWRAHVKTHKTIELTRFQVGDGPRPVKLIVSTLVELEFLMPLLQEYKTGGRAVNVLYGLPLGPAQVPRLAGFGKLLGPDSISILVDHSSQLACAQHFAELAGFPILAHIKIDMGGRRAGVILESGSFTDVTSQAVKQHEAGHIKLSGLYSHAGHSYGGDSQVAAMSMLRDELKALMEGAAAISKLAKSSIPPLTLSVGATPTALSIKNLLDEDTASNVEVNAAAKAVRDTFAAVKQQGAIVEIHAGVYPLLDLQQLAAHSLSTSQMSWSDIAFTLIAEVCSVYPGRGAGGYDEALIGAGGLALGRETCKAYAGMALLTPWNRKASMPTVNVEDHRGWQVGRFAQEHGIVTWTGGQEIDELVVGQKVRLWSNHACITSSHFGWYFVVDSSREGKEDEVVDIWVKARGW